MALETNDAGLSARLVEAPLDLALAPVKQGRSWATAVSDIRGPLA